MFMNNEIATSVKPEVIKLLKSMGVSDRWKKLDLKPETEHTVTCYKVFHTSLELVEKISVQIPQSKDPVDVPVFVVDACRFINKNLNIEGLFRIAGSAAKQRELMALLDSGNRLGLDDDQSITNVANTLKMFFRELPEPLIPNKFQNLFLKCMNMNEENRMDALLLACLLLPASHLNTLCYIIQFLNTVSKQSSVNLMDDWNLAIIFAPTFMPPKSQKLTRQASSELNQRMKIIQILIQHAAKIGVVPYDLCEQLRIQLEQQVHFPSTHNEPCTSGVQQQGKKRKSSVVRMITGIKRIMRRPSFESSSSLTASVYQRTPGFRGRSLSTSYMSRNTSREEVQQKREEPEGGDVVVTNSGHFSRTLTTSCLQRRDTSDQVGVARNWESEFMNIKKRLFLLENKLNNDQVLSNEVVNVVDSRGFQGDMDTMPPSILPLEEVDFEFGKHSIPIRSPSARKIGSFRNKRRVSRHSSLNLGMKPNYRQQEDYISKKLRRGKPNTVYSGLPLPMSLPVHGAPPFTTSANNLQNSKPHNYNSVRSNQGTSYSVDNNMLSNVQLLRIRSPLIPESRRSSINIFRQTNAGYVLKKARMFGDLKSVDYHNNQRNACVYTPPFKALPNFNVKERPTVDGHLSSYRSARIPRS